MQPLAPHDVRLLRGAVLLVTAGIVYGSLIPFEYRDVPFDQALSGFLRLEPRAISAGSRADWVANILLYVPFGFAMCGAVRGGLAVQALVALALGTALAFAVEFVQIWAAPRTVSLADILAEILGSSIGIATWISAGPGIVNLLRSAASGSQAALRAGLLLYLGVYLFIEMAPFDFFVSVGEFGQRLASGQAVSWLSIHYGTGLRAAAGVANKVVSAIPLGVLIFLYARRWPVLLLAGVGLGFGLELIQLFEISGDFDILSIFIRFAGCAAGFACASALSARPRSLPSWIVGAAWVFLPVYLLFLHILLNRPEEAAAQNHAEILSRMHWLPFYYYYYTTEQNALASFSGYLKLYLLLGAIVWILMGARDRGAGLAAIIGMAVQAILEIVGFWFFFRRPDATNVLIATLGSAMGFAFSAWFRRSLAEGLAVQANSPRAVTPAESSVSITPLPVQSAESALLLSCIGAFILYGSLYPFNFTLDAVTFERIRDLFLPGEGHSRGDIVANIALFVPFGFLSMAALETAIPQRVWRFAAMLALSLAVAFIAQIGQLFLPTRDASADDVILNMIGAMAGGMAAIRWQRIQQQLTSRVLGSPEWILSFLWIGALLLPLVPALDFGQIKASLVGLLRPADFDVAQAIVLFCGWFALAELWRESPWRYFVLAAVVLAASPLFAVPMSWLYVFEPIIAFLAAAAMAVLPRSAKLAVPMLVMAICIVSVQVSPGTLGPGTRMAWINTVAVMVFAVAALIHFAMTVGIRLQAVAGSILLLMVALCTQAIIRHGTAPIVSDLVAFSLGVALSAGTRLGPQHRMLQAA